MVGQECDRAVNLLGRHHPHQHMRPGGAAEGDGVAGRRAHRGGQAVRRADRPAEGGDAALQMTAQQGGELRARQIVAALVQRQQDAALGHRLQPVRLALVDLDEFGGFQADPPPGGGGALQIGFRLAGLGRGGGAAARQQQQLHELAARTPSAADHIDSRS